MKWWHSTKARIGKKSIEVTPLDEVHRLLHLAYGHLRLEEYEQARSVLLQAAQYRHAIEEPDTVNYLLMSLESTWLFTEQFEEGRAFFADYISRYPRDSAAYSGRAEILWYSGRLQEAIEDYSYSLELKPKDIISLSGRGQVLAELGNYEAAMGDLSLALEALRAAPKAEPSWARWYEQIEAFVHNGLGFALGGLGEIERAIEEFDQSIKMSQDNAWVYHNRARVYDSHGNSEKAKVDYEKALKKRNPSLNPLRREQARIRLTQLSAQL